MASFTTKNEGKAWWAFFLFVFLLLSSLSIISTQGVVNDMATTWSSTLSDTASGSISTSAAKITPGQAFFIKFRTSSVIPQSSTFFLQIGPKSGLVDPIFILQSFLSCYDASNEINLPGFQPSSNQLARSSQFRVATLSPTSDAFPTYSQFSGTFLRQVTPNTPIVCYSRASPTAAPASNPTRLTINIIINNWLLPETALITVTPLPMIEFKFTDPNLPEQTTSLRVFSPDSSIAFNFHKFGLQYPNLPPNSIIGPFEFTTTFTTKLNTGIFRFDNTFAYHAEHVWNDTTLSSIIPTPIPSADVRVVYGFSTLDDSRSLFFFTGQNPQQGFFWLHFSPLLIRMANLSSFGELYDTITNIDVSMSYQHPSLPSKSNFSARLDPIRFQTLPSELYFVSPQLDVSFATGQCSLKISEGVQSYLNNDLGFQFVELVDDPSDVQSVTQFIDNVTVRSKFGVIQEKLIAYEVQETPIHSDNKQFDSETSPILTTLKTISENDILFSIMAAPEPNSIFTSIQYIIDSNSISKWTISVANDSNPPFTLSLFRQSGTIEDQNSDLFVSTCNPSISNSITTFTCTLQSSLSEGMYIIRAHYDTFILAETAVIYGNYDNARPYGITVVEYPGSTTVTGLGATTSTYKIDALDKDNLLIQTQSTSSPSSNFFVEFQNLVGLETNQIRFKISAKLANGYSAMVIIDYNINSPPLPDDIQIEGEKRISGHISLSPTMSNLFITYHCSVNTPEGVLTKSSRINSDGYFKLDLPKVSLVSQDCYLQVFDQDTSFVSSQMFTIPDLFSQPSCQLTPTTKSLKYLLCCSSSYSTNVYISSISGNVVSSQVNSFYFSSSSSILPFCTMVTAESVQVTMGNQPDTTSEPLRVNLNTAQPVFTPPVDLVSYGLKQQSPSTDPLIIRLNIKPSNFESGVFGEIIILNPLTGDEALRVGLVNSLTLKYIEIPVKPFLCMGTAFIYQDAGPDGSSASVPLPQLPCSIDPFAFPLIENDAIDFKVSIFNYVDLRIEIMYGAEIMSSFYFFVPQGEFSQDGTYTVSLPLPLNPDEMLRIWATDIRGIESSSPVILLQRRSTKTLPPKAQFYDLVNVSGYCTPGSTVTFDIGSPLSTGTNKLTGSFDTAIGTQHYSGETIPVTCRYGNLSPSEPFNLVAVNLNGASTLAIVDGGDSIQVYPPKVDNVMPSELFDFSIVISNSDDTQILATYPFSYSRVPVHVKYAFSTGSSYNVVIIYTISPYSTDLSPFSVPQYLFDSATYTAFFTPQFTLVSPFTSISTNPIFSSSLSLVWPLPSQNDQIVLPNLRFKYGGNTYDAGFTQNNYVSMPHGLTYGQVGSDYTCLIENNIATFQTTFGTIIQNVDPSATIIIPDNFYSEFIFSLNPGKNWGNILDQNFPFPVCTLENRNSRPNRARIFPITYTPEGFDLHSVGRFIKIVGILSSEDIYDVKCTMYLNSSPKVALSKTIPWLFVSIGQDKKMLTAEVTPTYPSSWTIVTPEVISNLNYISVRIDGPAISSSAQFNNMISGFITFWNQIVTQSDQIDSTMIEWAVRVSTTSSDIIFSSYTDFDVFNQQEPARAIQLSFDAFVATESATFSPDVTHLSSLALLIPFSQLPAPIIFNFEQEFVAPNFLTPFRIRINVDPVNQLSSIKNPSGSPIPFNPVLPTFVHSVTSGASCQSSLDCNGFFFDPLTSSHFEATTSFCYHNVCRSVRDIPSPTISEYSLVTQQPGIIKQNFMSVEIAPNFGSQATLQLFESNTYGYGYLPPPVSTQPLFQFSSTQRPSLSISITFAPLGLDIDNNNEEFPDITGTQFYVEIISYPTRSNGTIVSPTNFQIIGKILTTQTITSLNTPIQLSLDTTSISSIGSQHATIRVKYAHPVTNTPMYIESTPFVSMSSCMTPPSSQTDYNTPSSWTNTCGIHGNCQSNGTCRCTSGFTGPKCTIEPTVIDSTTTTCDASPSSFCGSHGTCDVALKTCNCVSDWLGPKCQTKTECLDIGRSSCSNNGHFSTDPISENCSGTCECENLWISKTCNVCGIQCRNSGRALKSCKLPCGCPQGFGGPLCKCSQRQASFTVAVNNDIVEYVNTARQEYVDANNISLSSIDLYSIDIPNDTVDQYYEIIDAITQDAAQHLEISSQPASIITVTFESIKNTFTDDSNISQIYISTRFEFFIQYNCGTSDTIILEDKWSKIYIPAIPTTVINTYFASTRQNPTPTDVEQPALTPETFTPDHFSPNEENNTLRFSLFFTASLLLLSITSTVSF